MGPVDSMLGENPFAVLTSVVAPAILTNACSVLSLGTANRIARVVDQSRRVSEEMAALPAGSAEHSDLEGQLRCLSVRSRYLFLALRMIYTSLGAFAAAALIAVVGGGLAALAVQIGFQTAAVLGLVAGVAGVGCLCAGSVLLVREVRLALDQTADQAARALAPPPG